MSDGIIEARSWDNEWEQDRNAVRSAKQGVELRFWPRAGIQKDGGTARLALKWATIDTSDRQSVILPEACLLLTLEEMKALRDKADQVITSMVDYAAEAEEDEDL